MEAFGLVNELVQFVIINLLDLGVSLIGIEWGGDVELVLCVVLNVVTFRTHYYNLTNKNQIELNVKLSIYKYIQYQQYSQSALLMWKSIGSIPSPTGKSKEDVAYEPFSQASRLRLNQSQLSGDHSPQFMHQYFSKKRSPDALPHRNQSQRSLEVLPMHSPISSLRDVVSPEAKPKPPSISSKIKDDHSIIDGYKDALNNSLSHENKSCHRVKNQQLHNQLRRLKEDQLRLKKSVQQELNGIKNQIKQTETQILSRLNQATSESELKKKQGLNPEILSKIRQQSIRFNERIRDIQNRKQQVKEKYRLKNQK